MSAEASRRTNGNNSVTDAERGSSPELDAAADALAYHFRELPTPSERAAEFHAQLPERARLPLTREEGRRVRKELTRVEREEWTSEPARDWEESVSGETVTVREPVTWGEAVEELLRSHENSRNTVLNLKYGPESHPEHEEWSKPARTRWMPEYQKRFFAGMKGWLRELTGGERPSGGETSGSFDDPHIALVTRSASAKPGDERVAPLDHDAALSESWSDVYHTLRNTMRSLDLPIGEGWQYDRRQEPHKGERGGGANWCYTHEHIVIVTDGEVTPSDLRPVVEKHVESCELAGRAAHDLDVDDWDRNRSDVDTVTIKPADELEHTANYVADYCGIQPVDLLERDVEYLAWAAIKHANNTKTMSRSDAAVRAAKADACKQRAEHPETDQKHGHGDKIRRSEKRGVRLECAECGSPHGIDQDQTLSAARIGDADTAIAADGGADREERLRSRWPSARAAAAVGETPSDLQRMREIRDYLRAEPDASVAQVCGALGLPPDRDDLVRRAVDELEGDPRSFRSGPSWYLESVEVHGEEYPANPGGGVDMVEVDYGTEWLPPFRGQNCPCCGAPAGSEGVVSAREAREVYHVDVDGAYWCIECGEEFASKDASPVPPELAD